MKCRVSRLQDHVSQRVVRLRCRCETSHCLLSLFVELPGFMEAPLGVHVYDICGSNYTSGSKHDSNEPICMRRLAALALRTRFIALPGNNVKSIHTLCGTVNTELPGKVPQLLRNRVSE
jgi:hypothetical protein